MSAYEAMGLLAFGVVGVAGFATLFLMEKPWPHSDLMAAFLYGLAGICAKNLAEWVAYLLTTGGCR